MKSLSQRHIFTLFALLCACLAMPLYAENKVMDLDQLEVKGELRYLAGQAEPFTGNAVSYFADGMQKSQVSFVDGQKHGKEVAWYEDGQLRYVVRYSYGEPQSVGSAWYARTNQTNVVVSALRYCGEDGMNNGFCDPGLQESSHIEFTPTKKSNRIEFTP